LPFVCYVLDRIFHCHLCSRQNFSSLYSSHQYGLSACVYWGNPNAGWVPLSLLGKTVLDVLLEEMIQKGS